EVHPLVVAVVLYAHRRPVAGAEEVVLLDGEVGDQAGQLRVTDAELEGAGGTLLDTDLHVNQVLRTGNAWRFDLDVLEIAKTLQPDLGTVDGGLREPGAFELAHLAAQHFVLGAGVALEDHPAHVHALARVDQEGDSDLALLAVHVGDRRDLGKGVADVAEHGGDRVAGALDPGPGIDVARLDLNHTLEGFLPQDKLAGEAHVPDRVDLTLADAGGDVDVAPVGADGDLVGVDAEVQVAAVLVERNQLFQVAGEF